MTTEFFTRPKHDFTRLGRVDGWLGRTLQGGTLDNYHNDGLVQERQLQWVSNGVMSFLH